MDNESLMTRLKHAWNVFTGKDSIVTNSFGFGIANSLRPDRSRLVFGVEKSILSSIYTRIAIDVSANTLSHVKTDKNGRFVSLMNSDLHNALTLSANTDQTGRALMQDIVMSLFDEGCVAVVPIDTDINPEITGGYSIKTLRVGKITQWFPQHIGVDLYNEKTGQRQEVVVSKSFTAILENPLYAVMNGPNSTLKRLIRKLNLLDNVDEIVASGKLDLIIQLPYLIKTETRQQQAEKRRQDIEKQLSGSKYGIAYTDGTEKITQLNRPIENNFQSQIEYLTNLLYAQLGLTPAVFDGTATEQVMLNYYNRTIEPVLSTITDEFNRKFLTKTARTQGQKIMFFKDPFKMISTNNLAEIADKFTRNEILTSNEVRSIIGMYPSEDPKADELRNKNLSQPTQVAETEQLGDELEALNSLSEEEINEILAEYNLGSREELEELLRQP